ncbi:hypothetical protein HZY97_20150 [Sphingomonas sp. R-74633]|uniref:DUF4376 domain-containing protein n=1 Tax=Sphingomonas sp. R-74633 TaxID=2751188 RepID=UPI0015D0DF2F|nr:hypothetical protein [Sphingomonas sp. R-74633]NYT43098.1 hypothetical protein [Sphingomonas sp. R-74633]
MSDTWWVIEEADGRQHVIADDPTPAEIEEGGEIELVDRYPEAVRRSSLPRCLDLAQERWDFDAAAIITRWSPEQARDLRWEEAKRYRVERQTEPLAVADIVPGQVIVAQRDEEGQKWIDRYSSAAETAIRKAADFSIVFTDAANSLVSINADQILLLRDASLIQQALCHAASQGIRAQLDAALAAGATAAEILSIDITEGYPEA